MVMKNLKDVLEKLKVDDIIIDKFPIDGSIEDIIKFLIENGYKEIPYEKYWEDTIDRFSDTADKSFMADFVPNGFNSNMICLSFIDKSNREFKNILFSITGMFNKYEYTILDIETGEDKEDAKVISKSQFLKKVNKLF